MIRRIVSIVTMMVFLLGLAAPVMAQEESARISQEQALKIAREAFNIPDNVQNIQISYREEQFMNRKIWDFNWDLTKFGKFHSISVGVDADTGDVINFSENREWNPQKKPGKLKSKEECKALAVAMLQKLAPQKFSETNERSNPYLDMSGPYGPSGYGFVFERVVNGIPFPENSINITIDAETGKVANYYLNWDANLSFPPADKVITAADAGKIFKEKIGLNLAYVRPYGIGTSNLTKKKPVNLYYTFGNYVNFYGNPSAVDAKTGKVIDQFGKDVDVAKEVYYPVKAEPTPPPHDKVLTLEEAKAIAQQSIRIPSNFKLQSSRYSDGWGGQNLKMWEFQYGSDSNSPGQQLSITINALNGELSNFNYWNGPWDEQQDKPINYDYNRCTQIASDFLKKVAPQKAEYVNMVTTPVPKVYYFNGKAKTPPSYSFSFTRIVNGVPFPMNTIYIEVDNNTGEVRSYSAGWDYDLTFADNKPVLTEEEAVDKLLETEAPRLTYAKKVTEDGRPSTEVMLIYQSFKDYPKIVDAKTGNVTSEIELQRPVKLDDIKGHWAEREIGQLAAMGAVAGNNNKFYPDKLITRAEFVTMLVTAKGMQMDENATQTFTDVPKSAWCFDAVQAAVKAGLVKGSDGKFQPDQVITKQEMVAMIIKALNGDAEQEIPEDRIPKQFKDFNKIAPWAKQAVIQALGMGIVTGQDGYLNITNPATRAEAAVMLIRAQENSSSSGVSRYGMYYR